LSVADWGLSPIDTYDIPVKQYIVSQIVSIPPRQVRWAKEHAKARNEFYKNETDWNDERSGDPLEDNFVGIMGELGFSVYYDVQIDAGIHEISDGGSDFLVQFDGEERSVDVKTRRKYPDRLWVKEKAINADYYILAHLIGPDDGEALEGWSVELFGGTSSDKLRNATRVESDFGFWNRSIFVENLETLPDQALITSG